MPLPVDYQTCTVTGAWVNLSTGEPGTGYVVFTPRATRITSTSEVILPSSPLRVWLVDGAISVELPATDDPDVQPVGWTYQVVETIDGDAYTAYDIEAPAGGAVDLSSVAGVGSTGTIVVSRGTVGNEIFIPATTLHGSTAVQSNWSSYPTRAHAFHLFVDSSTSTVGAMLGRQVPWGSVDVYAVVGNPSAGGGDVRWTFYYGKDAGLVNTRSSVSSTSAVAADGATYPAPQRVQIGDSIAWDEAGDWALVLSRIGADVADTLASPIHLQGIAVRNAST